MLNCVARLTHFSEDLGITQLSCHFDETGDSKTEKMSIYHLQVLVCENLLVLPWKQKLKTNQMIRVDIKLSLSFITPNFNRWFIRAILLSV